MAAFLASAFQLNPDAPFLRSELLQWKYFEPRPDWDGGRSFLLRRDGRIMAHGCLAPLTFLAPRGEVTSLRVIDWAGSRSFPGAGARLMKLLATFAETVLAPGGSPHTLQILPKIGFQLYGYFESYARVIHPWSQFRSYPSGDWKKPLRLLRNFAWSCKPLPRPPLHWSASRISEFDQSMLPLLNNRLPRSFTPPRRSIRWLNYMLRCPGAAFSAFLLRREQEIRGYFVCSRVGGQSRLAEVWINSELPQDWHAAYSLATRTLAHDPNTCEATAIASIDLARRALLSNGFVLRRREPIYVYDPKGLLDGAPPLHLSLLDGDECYLHNPASPYLT